MDITALLTDDHREVEQLFERFTAAAADERRDIAQSIIRELSAHDAIEVAHLYPASRKLGEHGEKLTEHSLGEHHEVRDILVELDRNLDSAGTAEYEAVFQKLVEVIKDHVEEEENEIFPFMRRTMAASELEELGAAAERSKRTAPTRPHPSTPDSPTAARVMGRAAGVLDRLRDRAAGRTGG